MGVIARRVREVRSRHQMTAQDLAERMTTLGLPWNRTTVVKLENGRRENVSVTELLVLAEALATAPVNLLVPVTDEPYQVTPARTESSDVVREWVRGNKPLPGTSTEDQRTFYAEVPLADIKRRGHIVPLGTAYDDTPQGGTSGEHREAP